MGLTSAISSDRSFPDAASISIASCASRYVSPPRTGVPTPGASSGSIASMSSDRWMPSPLEATAMAFSIAPLIPKRSMSAILIDAAKRDEHPVVAVDRAAKLFRERVRGQAERDGEGHPVDVP